MFSLMFRDETRRGTIYLNEEKETENLKQDSSNILKRQLKVYTAFTFIELLCCVHTHERCKMFKCYSDVLALNSDASTG